MGRVPRRDFLVRAARFSGGAALATTAGSGVLGAFLPRATSEFDFGVGRGAGATPGRGRGGDGDGPHGLRVITRAEWGADESRRRGGRQYRPVRKFVVHHTVTPSRDSDPSRTMRDIYGLHLGRYESGRYWSDIGYHFVIDPEGRVYEGRYAREFDDDEVHDGEDRFGRAVVGSHAGEVNGGSMGIALMGDFTGRSPTAEAVESLVRLLTWKCRVHGLDPQAREPFQDSLGRVLHFPTVVGHRHVRTTACPGGYLQNLMPRIRRAVALRLREEEEPDRGGAADGSPGGYQILTAQGLVAARGGARHLGDPWHLEMRPDATAVATTPDGRGYFVLTDDGAVFAFGRADFRGSLLRRRRKGAGGSSPAVDLAVTPSGKGYWVLTARGNVVAFGDAPDHGSVAGQVEAGRARLRPGERCVALAPTPSGAGYWVLSERGAVFSFGDARFRGRPPRVTGGATDLAATPDGRGYWVLSNDGGVFSFGSARFHGSLAERRGDSGGTAIVSSPTGRGYLVLTDDGAVLPFGDATAAGHGPALPAADLSVPAPPRRVTAQKKEAPEKEAPAAKRRPEGRPKRRRVVKKVKRATPRRARRRRSTGTDRRRPTFSRRRRRVPRGKRRT